MVVVKADGYGHGMVPVARAARAAGAEWLGVATGAEALALREAGDTGRVLCWLAAPGRGLHAADRGRRRRHGLLGRPARGDRRRRPRGRSSRAGAAEGRHRAVPRGRPAVEWPALVRGGPRGRAGGRGPGHRALVALRLLRRAGPPGQRRPVGGLRRGAGAGRRTPGSSPRCGTWPTPPARSCTPAARYDLVRLGIAVYGLSPAPDVRTDGGAGAGPGDDGARVRRTHQGAGGRRRRLLRAHLRGRASRCGWRWSRWGTATASRGTPPRPPRCSSAECAAACSAGSAWTSSSSRRPTAHAGDEVVLFGPGSTASRRRPTGRAGAARSTTRSSPGWVAGRPGSGSGTRTAVSTRRSPGLRRRRARGAAAAAAVATGVVVERRVVKARRAGAAEADRLGALRSDPVEVTCDDGVVLHAEVDEVAPYAGRKRRARAHGRRRWCSCTATRSTWTAGTSSARRSAASTGWCSTTSARTAARSGRTASTRPSTSSATTWPACIAELAPEGRGRPGRPLDGRDVDHRLRRAAPRAVREAGRGRGAGLHHGRWAAAAPHPEPLDPRPVRPGDGPARDRRAGEGAGAGRLGPPLRVQHRVPRRGHVRVRQQGRPGRARWSSSTRCWPAPRSTCSPSSSRTSPQLDKFEHLDALRRRCRPRSSAAPRTS